MKRFDPAKSALLDDPARFAYLSLETVFALLDAPRGATVVDYGAGTGAFAIPLAHARRDLRVVAYDVEPRMLALARAKPEAAGLGNLVLTGALDGDLRANVSRVLGVNVLHELDDRDLERIAALLDNGGLFVSIDWNASAERPAGPPPEKVYSIDEARTFLERAGLRVAAHTSLTYHEALVAEHV